MVTLLVYFINMGCDTLAIVMFVDNYRESVIHNQVFSLITVLLFLYVYWRLKKSLPLIR